MNSLIIPDKLWTDEVPQKEGKYLWKGSLSNSLTLLEVVYYPEKYEYGLAWSSYYGIVGMRGRNAQQLKGMWIKLEEEHEEHHE